MCALVGQIKDLTLFRYVPECIQRDMNSNSIRTTSNTEQLGSRREARTNQKLSNNISPAVLTYTVNTYNINNNDIL